MRSFLEWETIVKINMKTLSLLLWVTQFGFSVLFPICFFLLLGTWMRNRFELGIWAIAVCGLVGLLTSVSSARSCIHALRKAAEEAGDQKEPPVSFNDHE